MQIIMQIFEFAAVTLLSVADQSVKSTSNRLDQYKICFVVYCFVYVAVNSKPQTTKSIWYISMLQGSSTWNNDAFSDEFQFQEVSKIVAMKHD